MLHFEVLFADGDEAIGYAKGVGSYGDRARHPLPDIVLLDLKMPRINGFGHTPTLGFSRDRVNGDLARAPDHCGS